MNVNAQNDDVNGDSIRDQSDETSSASIFLPRNCSIPVNSAARQNGHDSVVVLDDTVESSDGISFDSNVTPVKLPRVSNSTSDVEFKTPTSVRRSLGIASSPQTPTQEGCEKSCVSSPCSSAFEVGPSPYKSSRPNYLPKNVKLYKKKTDQRRQNLEIIKQVETDLTATLQDSSVPVVHEATPKVLFDTCGTQLPLLNVFQPELYFINFNESSLKASDYVENDSKFAALDSSVDIKRLLLALEWNPLALKSQECRYLTYLLTVTSDPAFVECVSPLIWNKLKHGSFFLAWSDVKRILVNFGLSHCATLFCERAPNSERLPPRIWNFEFFFTVVQLSYPRYSSEKVMRLLSLLVDCYFESLLIDINWKIGFLMREVAEYLISKSMSPCDIARVFNRSLFSMVHNRFIFSFLASEPNLEEVMRLLGLRTIGSILDVPEVVAESCSLEELLDLMTPEKLISLNAKDATQLLFICEKWCLMSGDFDISKLKLAQRLSDLAKLMHQNFKHVDALYLCQAAIRFEAFVSAFPNNRSQLLS